jgi:hypothetical protein
MEHDTGSGIEAAAESSPVSFVRRTAAMLGVGLLGLLGLSVTTVLQVTLDTSVVAESGLPADASLPVVVLASVATPAVLLAIAAAVGTATAPRVGFRSLVHDRIVGGTAIVDPLLERVPRALAVGVATGAGIVLLDLALTTLVPAATVSSSSSNGFGMVAASAPARLLFGGVAEELLLRWGLVSALAWALAVVIPGERERVPGERTGAIAWAAVVLAALAFGAAHLPAAAATTTLTIPIIVRIVVLNALAGVVFGWLYVTDALESAMLAHAGAHIPLLTAALISVA